MKKIAPLLFFVLAGCDTQQTDPSAANVNTESISGITEKTDTPPLAPTVSYEALIVSDDTTGPFTITGEPFEGMITYLSRAGAINLLEYATPYYEYPGYVVINSAYQFGPEKYVLIVSTGEGGRSCQASTYAIAFDTRGEYVAGSTRIDGCSETVQAFADGNKLQVKKEGEITTIFNAQIN